MNWSALSVFVVFFALVTVIGFYSARWRRGDLNHLNEWGLAGRRFGTVISWFLIGGDLYTAYTFIAIPALLYGSGAIGFFGVPYTIVIYPFVFLVMPRLWSVARKHGYITASDFMKGRFGSGSLALAVALTGIVATMPYIALQLVGIQVVLQSMGIGGAGIVGDLPLIIAFAILAAYTYTSGLRAPASIAIVKDLMIYITIIVILVVVPARLGGFGHIFATAQAARPATFMLSPKAYAAYGTLAFGSALALFLYPHAITGVFSSKSRGVIKRNAALLPAYSLLLAFITLLGYMAITAGIHTKNTSLVVPLLILKEFPSWFAGFAFAAIAIGALVPAAVMSIAAANLFTRNIYKEYFRPAASPAEESKVAKIVSLIVKLGALFFIVVLPHSYAINLQLLGGVWILQTLPPVIIGLFTRWFHRWALLLGWLAGMVIGTWMAVLNQFKGSVFALHIGGHVVPAYAAVWALIGNLIVVVVVSVVLRLANVSNGADQTSESDYQVDAATT